MREASIQSEPARVNAIALADRWWSLALRGVAAIAFGVITLVAPGISLYALVFLFGGYALVDGAFNLAMAARGRAAAAAGARWSSRASSASPRAR